MASRIYGSSFLSFGASATGWTTYKTFTWQIVGPIAELQDGSDGTFIQSFFAATGFAEIYLPDSAIPDNSNVTLAEWDVRASGDTGTFSFPSINGAAASNGWATEYGFYNEFTRSTVIAQTGAAVKAAGWGIGHNAASGSGSISEFCLRLTFTLPTPSATTSAATNTTSTTATLNGIINPNSATFEFPVSYKFQYGLTAAYGSESTTVAGNTGTSNIAATGNLTGLAPNTVYHYRMVAFNLDVVGNGSDMTFVSAPTDTISMAF